MKKVMAVALSAALLAASLSCTNVSEAATKLSPLDKKVSEILKEVTTTGMTDFQKIYSLHKYIVNHVEYDRLNYEKDTIPSADYTATGALLNGVAVCQGYASGYSTLLNASGVKSKVVSGRVPTGAHAWVAVLLNAKWYYIDPTWDDRDNGQKDAFKDSPLTFKGDIHEPNTQPLLDLNFDYFLNSEAEMIKKDHKISYYPIGLANAATDTTYDNMDKASLISDTGPDVYFFRGVAWTAEEEATYRATRKAPVSKIDIIKIDKKGLLSYPIKGLVASSGYQKEPQINNGYLYYFIKSDSKPYTEDVYRVSLKGGTPELVSASVSSMFVEGNNFVYVLDETDYTHNQNGVITNVNFSLHVKDLASSKDITLAEGKINSSFIVVNGSVYFAKRYSSGNASSVVRVAIEGGTPVEVEVLEGVNRLVSIKDNILTYSTSTEGKTIEISN